MRPSLVLTSLAVAALTPVATADILFSDTEFPTAGWGVESVLIGGGGSVTNSQVLSGGNPGAFRRVDMTPGPTVGDAIYTLHRYGVTTATRYDPATQGAILTLDFHIDFRNVPPSSPFNDQTVFFGAKQGTAVFRGPGFRPDPSPAFASLSFSDMTAGDFISVGSSATFDLSATGAPIRFGFITYVVNTTGPNPSRSEYDNFSVTIHQAPAPGSLALAGLAGLVVSRRRRR